MESKIWHRDPIYKTETDDGRGEQTCGSCGGEGREWDKQAVIQNWWAVWPYCTAQGSVCDWVTLLYDKNWRNIINKLHFNKKMKASNIFILTQIATTNEKEKALSLTVGCIKFFSLRSGMRKGWPWYLLLLSMCLRS